MKQLEKPMYYGAKSDTLDTAAILRRRMTFQENLLWAKLRNKQINGLKFRRQHPIDIFIADFYCHSVKLVVEVDGDIHLDKKDYDIGRSAEMAKFGIKVIRFKNGEVEKNINEVVEKIKNEVERRIQYSH